MAFFGRTNSAIERAAMALAAAGGVAHAAFFTLFAWRVIGRDGFGTIGWAVLALFALIGMGLNFAGFWLVRDCRRSVLRCSYGSGSAGASSGVGRRGDDGGAG